MRLCITGSFGNQDIGDDAMLWMHRDYLKASGLQDHEMVAVPINIKHLPSWWSRDDARDAPGSPSQYDGLLVTGGGTINTRGDGASLKRMHRLIMPFVKAGKPIFMSGQTIGPLGINKEHDRMAKEIIEAVDVLMVRDQWYSEEVIAQIGAKPKHLIRTTDDAVGLPYWHAPNREAVCAFNVTEYTAGTPEQITQMARLADSVPLLKAMFPHHPSDAPLLQAVGDQMGTPYVLHDTTNWEPKDLKEAIACCRCAIGARYHFIVFAATTGVPFIGLAGNEYSYRKQSGFAVPLGMGVYIWQSDEWDRPAEFSLTGWMKPRLCQSFGELTKWLNKIRDKA